MHSQTSKSCFRHFHLAASTCVALLGIIAVVWFALSEEATTLRVILAFFHVTVSVIGFAWTFGRWPWLYGTIPCFLAAMLVTPSNPALMLVVAFPLLCIYGVVVRKIRSGRTTARQP